MGSRSWQLFFSSRILLHYYESVSINGCSISLIPFFWAHCDFYVPLNHFCSEISKSLVQYYSCFPHSFIYSGKSFLFCLFRIFVPPLNGGEQNRTLFCNCGLLWSIQTYPFFKFCNIATLYSAWVVCNLTLWTIKSPIVSLSRIFITFPLTLQEPHFPS